MPYLFVQRKPPLGAGEFIVMSRIVKPFSNKRETWWGKPDAKKAKSCFEQQQGELVHKNTAFSQAQVLSMIEIFAFEAL